jgi:predicted KAP-like P-loop ATPase
LEKIFNPSSSDNAERGKIVEDVCRVLFPQLKRIYGWVYSSSSEQEWRQEKRICSEEVFEKYFMLGVSKGELSEEEMKTTLALGDDHLKFAEGLNRLFERELGKRFLERFEDYIGKVPKEDILETIGGLFEVEDKIVVQPRGMMQAGADYQAARLVYLLLKNIPEKTQRKQTIIDAINKTSKIFLPVYFVSLITPDNTEVDSRNQARVELELSQEDADELKSLCVTKIKTAAAGGKLSKSPHLGVTMYRWLHWGNADEVKEYAKKLVETDEGVIDFLVGVATEVLSSSTGRRVEIQQKDISAFIDVELIKTRVAGIKDTEWEKLNKAQQEAVYAFLRSISPNE